MRFVGLIFIALLSLTTLSAPTLAASVKFVVNGTTITDNDINQRALFMRLERKGKSNADRRRLAQDELINEAVQLAGFARDEAKRLFGAPGVADNIDVTPLPAPDAQQLFLDRFAALLQKADASNNKAG